MGAGRVVHEGEEGAAKPSLPRLSALGHHKDVKKNATYLRSALITQS